MSSRREIVQQFWDINFQDSEQEGERNDSYFAYFEEQYRLAHLNSTWEPRLCAQNNICGIVQQLKSGESREKIKADLSLKLDKTSQNNEAKLSNAIDLAVRLWLMVHIGNVGRGVTGQTAIIWHEGYLKDVLNDHFHHQVILTDSVKFETAFNAPNLERIAGVSIQWTPNLVDHLRLKEDGKDAVLNLFYHASFLEYHKNLNIFPNGLIEETIRTLALLLPMHDPGTRKWFKNQHEKLALDPRAIKCGQLKLEHRQIDHFKFWHDRLVVVKQYFDDSKPRTIKQWWFDDRKRVQWFWVAILLVVSTILFGIIQCIEGGWQIYMAYHPK